VSIVVDLLVVAVLGFVGGYFLGREKGVRETERRYGSAK
jgi:hypothetical protein